ncbi:hypothetical protein VTJ04DRAFT_767 [Mycothermus thermophilus]|uniref:uncharacterized protein n=1 Tax=Humicola insolens TaxID=85995 RepID=UPI003743BB18
MVVVSVIWGPHHLPASESSARRPICLHSPLSHCTPAFPGPFATKSSLWQVETGSPPAAACCVKVLQVLHQVAAVVHSGAIYKSPLNQPVTGSLPLLPVPARQSPARRNLIYQTASRDAVSRARGCPPFPCAPGSPAALICALPAFAPSFWIACSARELLTQTTRAVSRPSDDPPETGASICVSHGKRETGSRERNPVVPGKGEAGRPHPR